MIPVEVSVNDAGALLAAGGYGPGALLAVERAPAADGPWTAVSTTPLVAGTNAYTVWDPSGDPATSWYRSRVTNADATETSAWSEPVRATSLRAYASVEDLEELLPRLASGTPRDRNVLADCLVRASAVIDARAGRDFYRHPQVSGEETRLYSPRTTGRRLTIPEGLVSASLVEVATYSGGTFTSIAGVYVILRPLLRATDEPYWYIDLSRGSADLLSFYSGDETVRVTGVFGFERVPAIVRGGTLALAREMASTILTTGGSPRGNWDDPTSSALLPTEAFAAVSWAKTLGPTAEWLA